MPAKDCPTLITFPSPDRVWGMLTRLGKWMFKPVDGGSLGIFRILFGLIMAFEEGYRHYYSGEVYHRLVTPSVNLPYPPLRMVSEATGLPLRVPNEMLFYYWCAMTLAALGIAVGGVVYRPSAVALFVLYTYQFLWEQATYNNHYYLICLLLLVFAVTDTHTCYSLSWSGIAAVWARASAPPRGSQNQNPTLIQKNGEDHRSRPPRTEGKSLTVANWHQMSLISLLVVVYVFGAIAKVNVDWLRGEPLRSGMVLDPFPDWWWLKEVFVVFLGGGGLLFDLLVGFGLLYKPTRALAVLMSLYFHSSNFLMFSIGIFPPLMICTTVLFYDRLEIISLAVHSSGFLPAWMTSLVIESLVQPAVGTPSERAKQAKYERTFESRGRSFTLRQKIIMLLLALFFAHQTLVPFRHMVFNDDIHIIAWNNHHHNFSWRMKLRWRRCDGFFFHPKDLSKDVEDPDNQEEISYWKYVNTNQFKTALDTPDAMLLLTHAIHKRTNRPVHADIICGLNGRPMVPFVNTQIDLGIEPFPGWFGGPRFLHPLEIDIEYEPRQKILNFVGYICLIFAFIGTAVGWVKYASPYLIDLSYIPGAPQGQQPSRRTHSSSGPDRVKGDTAVGGGDRNATTTARLRK